jgi:hypothetical protein
MFPPQGVSVGTIKRSQLEYPTVDVKLMYLAAIDKAIPYGIDGAAGIAVNRDYYATTDSLTDLAVEQWTIYVADDAYRKLGPIARLQDAANMYMLGLTNSALGIIKMVNDGDTLLASYGCSSASGQTRFIRLSVSGSMLKGWWQGKVFSATDTTFASGKFGSKMPSVTSNYMSDGALGFTSATFRSPSSPSPQSITIIETDICGSGKVEDPYRPSISRNLVEITSLTGLPDYLYLEAKKYSILKAKGFTDEEIQLLLGYIPQHQIDLDVVTWGAFELHTDKAPTVIITITGDNPYKSGAIQRQIDFAKSKNLRVFSPPRDYSETIALYNQLKRDYPHWLAGKENFAYQTLGWEILDWMQNVDFYYGELLDHKTHYQQLKQVSDKEITSRLNELIDKLSRETALTDERDKHIGKAKEILKKGW